MLWVELEFHVNDFGLGEDLIRDGSGGEGSVVGDADDDYLHGQNGADDGPFSFLLIYKQGVVLFLWLLGFS